MENTTKDKTNKPFTPNKKFNKSSNLREKVSSMTKDNIDDDKLEDKPFKPDRAAKRNKRKRNKRNADTMEIQDRLLDEGHISVAEMSMLMASDAFDNLAFVEDSFGILSDEYKDALVAANNCIRTALPYFTKQASAVDVTVKEEIDENDVKDSIRNLLKSNPLSLDIE